MTVNQMALTNRAFSHSDGLFTRSCKLGNTPETVRQASKFRRSKGRAYEHIGEAKAELAKIQEDKKEKIRLATFEGHIKPGEVTPDEVPDSIITSPETPLPEMQVSVDLASGKDYTLSAEIEKDPVSGELSVSVILPVPDGSPLPEVGKRQEIQIDIPARHVGQTLKLESKDK